LNKPKPYLDGIEIDYITDKTTASMSFQAGESTALRTSGNEAATLMAKGYRYTKTSGGFFSLTMDGANASTPFGNLLARQAVGYALDTKALAQAVGFGTYDPVNQLAPSSHWAYNPAVKGYPYDPSKAKQLLKDAGYPNGFQTTLYGTSAVDQTYYQSIQGYLRDVGIDVRIEMVTTEGPSWN
jgi:ABC-type transport system substrate-binding protein